MLLTDHYLLDYKRCQRRAFLNLYGDRHERDPDREFLLKLRQESQSHVAMVLAEFYPDYQQPQGHRGDWLARAKETESLMQQGVGCIYGGMLLQSQAQDWALAPEFGTFPEDESLTLAATPHLLIKQPGRSKFGDWLYLPISIQLGRRPKPEYKIIATFHGYLLNKIQGTLPSFAQIILRRQNNYHVNLLEWLPRLQEILTECVQMLSQRQEPEVFISRQRCSLCHWHGHCYAIAQSQKHLSLVPGVTPSRYESLQAMGVVTVESLAAACPINMGEVMGIEVASQLQQQAQSLVENRAMLKSSKIVNLPRRIPTSSIEFYFDIEAEPELNLDYLLGIVLCDHQENTQKFYPFLAEKPEDEQQIWEEFLDLVTAYENAPIFHFSEYEVETIKRLARLYPTPRRKIENILSRCVDLHHYVTTSVTLPVESYSLKSLANWLGFHWRDRGVSGDQSVCWYDQWIKTGDRSFLEAILRYNEDDCLATLHLKNWLSEFLD